MGSLVEIQDGPLNFMAMRIDLTWSQRISRIGDIIKTRGSNEHMGA